MFFSWLKNHFIPHEGNDYAPNALEKTAMLGMLLLVVTSFAFTNLFSVLWMHSSWLVGTVLPAVVVALTNEERGNDALPSLTRNATLDAAARMKARHMAEGEYFAHYSPEGVSPWHWFGEAGYSFVHAGENLAVHFTESDAVVEGWMGSPTHRANILNGNYTEIGVGTAEGTYEGFKTVFVVQLFGTPAVPKQAAVAPVPTVAGEEAGQGSSEAIQTETRTVPVVASENVSITQQVVMHQDAPPAKTPKEEVVTAVEELVVVSHEVTPDPMLAVTDAGPILYTDFISTSTSNEPLAVLRTGTEASTPQYFVVATQPHKLLLYFYTALTCFVLFCLTLSVGIEVKRQRPVQVAYALGLLCVMGALLYTHALLGQGVLIA